MTIKENIKRWIFEDLSEPSSTFNGLPPCPYAKQSWINNKVIILHKVIHENIARLLEEYEVIIYAFDPLKVTPKLLLQMCEDITDDKIVALDDHPLCVEKVKDKILNNGKYALILVQERQKLDNARKILLSKGYYKHWDEQYYKEVTSI